MTQFKDKSLSASKEVTTVGLPPTRYRRPWTCWAHDTWCPSGVISSNSSWPAIAAQRFVIRPIPGTLVGSRRAHPRMTAKIYDLQDLDVKR